MNKYTQRISTASASGDAQPGASGNSDGDSRVRVSARYGEDNSGGEKRCNGSRTFKDHARVDFVHCAGYLPGMPEESLLATKPTRYRWLKRLLAGFALLALTVLGGLWYCGLL